MKSTTADVVDFISMTSFCFVACNGCLSPDENVNAEWRQNLGTRFCHDSGVEAESGHQILP